MSLVEGLRGNCSLWHYDDITECGRIFYIDYIIPLVLFLALLFYVGYNYLSMNLLVGKYSTIAAYAAGLLPPNDSDESLDEEEPLLTGGADVGGRRRLPYGSSRRAKNEGLKEKHFSIEELKLVDSAGQSHGHVEVVRRNFMEKSRVIIEWCLCGVQFFVQIVIATMYYYGNARYRGLFPLHASFVRIFLWASLLGITSVRLMNVNDNVKWINSFPGNLWAASFSSYLLLFSSSVMPFRSVYIHEIDNSAATWFYKSQYYLDGLLFLILFTAKIGNKPALLYRTSPAITPSPEPVASIASFISWSWVNKLIWKAHLRTVRLEDVWGLILEDHSIFVLKSYRKFVNERIGKPKTFSHNLIYYFKNYLLLQAVWACLDGFAAFIPTILLRRVLEYVEDQSTAPQNLAWFYVFSMFLCRVVVAICQSQALFFGRRVCVRMKAIIISEIYTKALRRCVSPSTTVGTDESEQSSEEHGSVYYDSKTAANLGAIINLMSVDAFKVSEICAYLHSFVEAIVMAIIAMVLLYRLIGFAAIVGTLFMLIIMPLNFRLATRLGKLQKEVLAFTDKRIQKLNETFQAIRIIKFFSWEDNFERDIQAIREDELAVLLKRIIVWSLSSFVWFITATCVTTISFSFYIYVQGKVLTTPIAFTALSLFTLLRNPLDQFADMLSFVIQSKVSLDRVQEFLNEEETTKYEQLTVSNSKIGFENATICWDDSPINFRLRNINIDFKIGKLNVIIGPTGSGKTSLLMGLLGEMKLMEGTIYVPSLDPREDLLVDSDGMTNSIAYCSQAAWLLNDSVRNNILFNTEYNEERYQAVIEACGLKRDFQILAAGDQTEIGEKGMTLSGGQKQRVTLARALYSSARHLLLDDCLSAVDSHTALWIYENCIAGPLMEGRTCILVSHNVALALKDADWVIILEQGRVADQGEPMDLLNKGSLGDDGLVKSSILSRTNSAVTLKRGASTRNLTNGDNNGSSEALAGVSSNKASTNEDRIKAGKLVQDEMKSDGGVSLDVYLWFARLFGGLKVIIILAAIFVCVQGFFIGQSVWLRNWVGNHTGSNVAMLHRTLPSNIMEKPSSWFKTVENLAVFSNPTLSTNESVDKQGEHTTFYYLSLYFLIGATGAIASSLKTVINFCAGLNASRKIFNLVLKKVLYAKLRFFDVTPIGRIMNRFSKDIESVDQELTPYAEGAFGSLVQCLSTVFLIAYITPGFLTVALFVTIMYYFVGYFYLVASRELKRYDSITKSPIHQHFSETLVGITTIRAFGDERHFIKENLDKIDVNSKPFFYLWVTNRWLAFRIDLLGSLVILASGLFILLNVKNIDAGLAGISLTYAISFTEGALWFVRLYSNVEMTMNSVERLREYMVVEQEPYDQNEFNPPAEWPSVGKLEVNNLSLRYAPNLPKVIQNVTFTVEPRSKVGIVGRTGAGKSTIITAMFRFLEPDTGTIKLDNIDISSIGLKRLRQSITIIPQDPVLFAGTIRNNLDPYGEYSTESIFESLKRVNLIDPSESDHIDSSASTGSENVNKFLNLDTEITEGGSNLSQGQRQLVCLARSLLRNPKVIMLDEATASIDYASDIKIQQTIREEFSNSTILTIAHRLRSIIDYDKVLVMDAGKVEEYDHPYSLLLNKESTFYEMCEDSGELDVLIQLAKEAFVKRLNSK
ncbi:HEL267Cp [Eremothecium sinecaudum]|uniref:HEL267Cp n=1 Tax=Eremothecium sinecaudum TaxID=45286 RepID=A0A0X8HT64_9SACH|nr:HEL267Cp [Eremothecium sinecaudum]AMD21014.1 HEL267Cp [Eremothecium sinecaudum]